MDPDEALSNATKALRSAREATADLDDAEADTRELAALRDLADAFEGLDEWLTKGGFLPSAWAR